MLTHFSVLCCPWDSMGSFALWRICSPDGEPTKGAALWKPASFKKLDQTF